MRFPFLLVALLIATHPLFAEETLCPEEMKGWTIITAKDAIPSEHFAAEEFQRLFAQRTGIELPIADSPPVSVGNVFIGHGKSMAESAVGFGVDEFGEEGLRYIVTEENIAIAGGRPRGTLYGVYEFAERVLGIRFLTHDHTYAPGESDPVEIPIGEYTYTPPFSFRWSYYHENSAHPDFATRLRVNTVASDEKLGGKTHQNLINHTLMRWLPAGQYGEEHPEYFALVNGQRELEMGGGGPEPCVTNPEVVEIVADAVNAYLDENPDLQNISVSQNDNDAYCRCATCEAINQREGTPMGSHLQMVNAVAERVEKKHPDVKVGTLAYWYTRKAPKNIKPRDNIQIQLCSIECCTLHSIDDPNCERNREFCQDMSEWKQICNDIWVWNYNTDFANYCLPFPNLRSIGANVRFFLNNNVKGLFMQANGNGSSGEMCDLRNYVISRCIWHPGQESWPLVEEFCRLHYGEAAQTILDYLTMIHDNAEKAGVHPGCFPTANEVGLTPEVARKAMEFFQRAQQVAENDKVLQRVEKASICAYQAMIDTHNSLKYEDGMCYLDLPKGFENLFAEYVDLCHKHNMTRTSEHQALEEYLPELEKQKSGFPAVLLENDLWKLIVLPSENGKVIEMTHKPSGRNLVAAPNRALSRHRSMEEWGVSGYDHLQPAEFEAEVQDHSVILKKRLADGCVVSRTITLGERDKPAILFHSSLTHEGTEPKSYGIKVHPEFDTATQSGDASVLAAYIRDDGWKQFNQGWLTNRGPNDQMLESAKGGAYAFFNHEEGFGVLETYDPASYGTPVLFWSPGRSQINLELVTSTVELKQGETFSYEYRVEYLDEPPLPGSP